MRFCIGAGKEKIQSKKVAYEENEQRRIEAKKMRPSDDCGFRKKAENKVDATLDAERVYAEHEAREAQPSGPARDRGSGITALLRSPGGSISQGLSREVKALGTSYEPAIVQRAAEEMRPAGA